MDRASHSWRSMVGTRGVAWLLDGAVMECRAGTRALALAAMTIASLLLVLEMQAASAPADVTSVEVRVRSAVDLAATLALPRGNGRRPGIVLVGGSGHSS